MYRSQYRIIFKLNSPLHTGHRKIGNLMQTRSYVPGKNLWAAITARITRDNGSNNYKKTGKEINEKFRFSYFWPAISPDNTEVKKWDDLTTYFTFDVHDYSNLSKIYPVKKDSNKKPFDYLFLGSYASTSLNYERYGAEEGSLHEVEFISPVTRDKRQVYLVGSIWVKDSLSDDIKNWKKSIKIISIGGEQKYGWGRLELIECNEAQSNPLFKPGLDYFEWEGYLPAHIDSDGTKELQGSLEPLVGWETKEDNSQEVSNAKIAFIPGINIKNKENFKIIENGLWRVKT